VSEAGDPIAFLYSLETLGMKFGLETMTALCAALGHPEHAFRSVIVGGTNGKGSVTAMLSAALHAAGYRSARYTSPHLERLEERFVIAQQEVATGELRGAAARVQAVVGMMVRDGALTAPPTFFECTTAVAFELFRTARVDIAVLEVGLGGRLDATNVVTPVAAAITSIDLDHQAQLGSTIEEVAREKAGIIKAGVPVVLGPVPQKAERVIADVARKRDVQVIRIGTDVRVRSTTAQGRTTVHIESQQRRLDDIVLGLSGRHQASNAATATAVLDVLTDRAFPVDDRAAREALERPEWPGRLERFDYGDCEVLLDAAHNPAGAGALARYLDDTGWERVTLVFGAMRDKDIAGMLDPLLPWCAAVIATTPPNPRAAAATDVAAMIETSPRRPLIVEAVESPAAALARARELGNRVVAAGSMFLIGPLRGILRNLQPRTAP
jgi:dihydrofolate synthase/folylpolyglutamate synthase